MVPTQVSARARRRRLSACLAVALCATTLAACGSSSHHSASASAGSGGSSAGSGSLKGQTINYWASVEGAGPSDTTKTLTKEFKKFTAQTGVKVNMQVIPWSDLLQKILTSVTSGTGPDVMEIGNTWAPSLSASHGFLPFDTANMNAIGGASKFAASSLKVSGLPGQAPVSVPVYSEAYALFYNKADFKAAGISKPPATWAQLIADGKKLTTGGRYGIAIEGGSTSEAAHWAFLLGMQAGNPLYANGKWNFATAREAKAISTYVNMVGSEHIANPSDAQNNSNVAESDFANNKAAMLVWQNPMSTLAQLGMKPSEYGSAPLPSFTPGATGTADLQTFPAGINLAIPASTKHKAAALALVKFLTSTPVQVAINHHYGTFPPVLAAQHTPTFSTPVYKTLEAEYNNHAAPLPQVASESTMETDLGGAITHLISQAATGASLSTSQIQSALSSAQSQLNASSGK
ncbi:MAG TPA: sugar ABC transporter substrate-binding protein [Solirubrobacteraceae bacterium]|nr:sugar ABC transporter substrate-binding protein [Solirubrobacteraceae bacterium]